MKFHLSGGWRKSPHLLEKMKEGDIAVAHLSLAEAMTLLEVQTIPGKPGQLVRFRNWIERLIESRGETFVWANRHDLLNQWEEFSRVKFKNCV
jgi:hypothetical protein